MARKKYVPEGQAHLHPEYGVKSPRQFNFAADESESESSSESGKDSDEDYVQESVGEESVVKDRKPASRKHTESSVNDTKLHASREHTEPNPTAVATPKVASAPKRAPRKKPASETNKRVLPTNSVQSNFVTPELQRKNISLLDLYSSSSEEEREFVWEMARDDDDVPPPADNGGGKRGEEDSEESSKGSENSDGSTGSENSDGSEYSLMVTEGTATQYGQVDFPNHGAAGFARPLPKKGEPIQNRSVGALPGAGGLEFGLRFLQWLVEDRPTENLCLRIVSTSGIKQTECTCTQDLQAEVRATGADLDKEEQLRLQKETWLPMFHAIGMIVDVILRNPESPNSLMALLAMAVPIRRGQKKNSCPDFLIRMRGHHIRICASFLWEVAGYHNHPVIKEFLRAFVTGHKVNEDGSLHKYLHKRCITKCCYLDLFLVLSRVCIDEGKIVALNPELARRGKSLSKKMIDGIMEKQDSSHKKGKVTTELEGWNHYAYARDNIGDMFGNNFVRIAHPRISARQDRFSYCGTLVGAFTDRCRGSRSYNSMKHFANAGVVAVHNVAQVFEKIRFKATSRIGYSGLEELGYEGTSVSKAGAFVNPVRGCPHLVYSEPTPLTGDAIPAILLRLGVTEEEVTSLSGQSDQFVTEVVSAAAKLLPENKQSIEFRKVMTASVLCTTKHDMSDVKSYMVQTPHLDFTEDEMQKMLSANVYPFVLLQPLSMSGCFIRVHPHLSLEDSHSLKGHMVFIPPGAVYIMPASMVHSGAFRTSPLGNLRMHYSLFLLDPSGDVTEQMDAIPKTATQLYIGESEDVPHCFDVTGGESVYCCEELLQFYNLLGF